MKYKSKPTIVEAEQWFPGKIVKGIREISVSDTTIGICTTIHGQETRIVEGDYIIKEPDGIHYYPCKPDIFEKRYEKLE